MKNNKIILIMIVVSILMLQSCDSIFTGKSSYNEISGTVTDKATNNPIKNVKLTIYIDDLIRTNGPDEVTEHIAYTDDNGFYNIEYKREDGIRYYIKPTHENFVYGFANGWYPSITNGVENEINFEMEDNSIVRIEGRVDCPQETFYWLENVKISILKRPNNSSNYPETTGEVIFSNNEGKFYIEYIGDKDYEFFLKPEKEGYCFEYGGKDYSQYNNTNPGYVINTGLTMNKTKEY